MARVAFLDLEGTLLQADYEVPGNGHQASQWPAIAMSLGDECVNAELLSQHRWKNNQYAGYLEWVEDTCRIHKQYGLTESILKNIVASSKLTPGAGELVDFLKSAGIKTAILTGAVKAFADRVQRELKIDHSFAACEYFFDDEGRLEFWNTLPSDFLGKRGFMEVVIQEHGAKKEDCIFIGDGKNDVSLAEAVGYSVAFNADDELKRVANVVVGRRERPSSLIECIPVLKGFLSEY